jgi:zinc protease
MTTWILILITAMTAAAQPAGAPAARPAGRGPVAAAVAPAIPGPKDLKYPALRALEAPGFVTTTLSNGLKISLLEDRELPVVSGVALVHTGNLLDPPAKIGLAALAGAVLRTGGTAAKTPEQVDNLLDEVAASFESVMDDSYCRITFGAAKENAPAVLDLFKEVLTQPAFRQDKIDQARSRLRAAISQRNDDPAAIARRELMGVIHGKDSPYGWLQQYSTIDRVSRDDVRAFYRRYFFPANVTVALWGDFDAAGMKQTLEKVLGSWNPPAQAVPEFPKVRGVPAPGVYLAEKSELNDSYFAIGLPGGRADDKDLAPLEVLAAVLGGAPGGRGTGRLSAQARAKTGAPHEIHAVWAPGFDHPGLFEIEGSTRGIGTVDVLKVMQSEIERIRTAEISEEELQTARDELISGLVFGLDTRGKLVARQLTQDFYGYPKDYLAQFQAALRGVTRQDVLRVAKQYIVPANLVTVVVANPQMLGEPLDRLGVAVNKLDISILASQPDAAPSTDASLAEGKQLLQKAQAAAGGAEKLAAVKDFIQVTTYQVESSVPNIGGAKLTETDRWIAPTFFRQDTNLPAGHVAAYTEGRIGWISTPKGWGTLTGSQQKQVLGDLFRSWFRLLLSDRIEGRTVNAVDATSVEITDSTGEQCKVEFDSTTGLPRRVTYDTPQAVGPPIYTEDVYEEYGEFEGLKLPSKIVINQGGRKFADTSVTDFKLNSGLKVMDLARRPL